MHEHFVASGRPLLPLAGVADLEPCDLPRRGRPRPTFALPARYIATRHPRCETPPWPDCSNQISAVVRSPDTFEAASAVTPP